MPTLTAPDLSKIERPNLEMPDIDLSKFDLPKVDVGKAVAGAATAVGLMNKPRSRWPFVIGAGIAVAVAGWAWMNADMLRRRFSEAATAVSDRVATMRSGTDFDESRRLPVGRAEADRRDGSVRQHVRDQRFERDVRLPDGVRCVRHGRHVR